MPHTIGVASRKGGQGKSTTVSMLARLLALYGARVLVVDLAQPGTTTTSLRDIWPDEDHGELAAVISSLRMTAAGMAPPLEPTRATLAVENLPVRLASQPSWSGGYILALPWDDVLADAAAFLQSERVLQGLIASVADDIDVALLDYPAEGGPLVTNALVASDEVIIPLVPEIPSLEGVEATLRLLGRAREYGHDVALAGLLLTRCEPRSRRLLEIVQALKQAGEVEGEILGKKLFPFGIGVNEFYEQSFRYGTPIWERTSNPSHWAGYVLLAEDLLRRSGLAHLARARRGPALLAADTRVLDLSALLSDEPEAPLADFEKAHLRPRP
ncbi:MAG TPA: ParA family protein [Ktedonobacterales bacterium]|nr:ParA family protein [Ktedonobacterales bacterium]